MSDVSLNPQAGINPAGVGSIGDVDKTGATTKSGQPTKVEAGDATQPATQGKISLDPAKEKSNTGIFESVLGDDVSLGSMMKLLINLGQQNWQANMDSRQTELNSQVASIQKQAETMRGSAIANLIMGIVSGVVGIAGGIMSIASSIKSFKAQKAAGADIKQQQNVLDGAKKDLSDIDRQIASKTKIKDALKASGKMEEYSNDKLQGLNTSMDTVKKSVDAGGHVNGQASQADSKLEEANQARHQANMQKANDYVQYYSSMIRDIRNLIAQINQDVNQTARSVINKA